MAKRKGPEIASIATAFKMPSEKQMTKEHAKSAKRHATESWVSGHMTTAEHTAIHKRAEHILKGRPVHEFKGKAGERKIKLKANDG